MLAALAWVPINALSQKNLPIKQEIKDMKYLLEEEKVARDVYTFLDDQWHLRIFNNIKQSEQRHMDIMKDLLATNQVNYSISDQPGEFHNKKLQALYDSLTEKGSKSVHEALEVGKSIEIEDIKDLEEAIKHTTNENSKDAYSRLLFGSHNHLRAFNRNLTRFQ